MKKLLLSLSIVVALVSCSETKREEPVTCRAVCLESSTVTYARYPDRFIGVYKNGDTVWVNMTTHFIDDVDTNAQKCVLIQK